MRIARKCVSSCLYGTMVIFIVFLFPLGYCNSIDAPMAEVSQGVVLGSTVWALGGSKAVNAFMGIPYASPPVGPLRFQNSVPAKPWAPDILHATEKPPACVQFTPANPIPDWVAKGYNQSEDCLYLNVWTPLSNNKNKLKDVMVWIHGGGLNFGSSSMDLYDGTILAALGEVVVVSMNYRLGALGFLSLGNDHEAPGNQGLMDQVLALQWVKDNIINFGGNPDRITLFGESAGAWSIGWHILSPIASPLFSRAIIQSGGVYVKYLADSAETAEVKARALADALGCSSSNATEVISCIRRKPAREIALWESITCQKFPLCFVPSYGGRYLPVNPLVASDQGLFRPKDILTGNVENEGSVFVSLANWEQFPSRNAVDVNKSDMFFFFLRTFRFLPPAVVKQIYELYVQDVGENDYSLLRAQLGHALGDAFMLCPGMSFGEKLSSRNSRVYYYKLQHQSSSDSTTDSWIGLTHFQDIQYVFGLPLRVPKLEAYSEIDARYSTLLIHIWTTFAKTGRPPKVGNATWPRFTRQSYKTVVLDAESSNVEDLRQLDKCRFWAKYMTPALDSCDC
ncbi:acetylcholinesterase-like isoform X2 [Ornithodoros turicata]|uniref:acetylcholinesterase-like isoform X2 n=1 Tax=Ornithodoros turicata TaxID=34597 RepID=UPI003138DF60